MKRLSLLAAATLLSTGAMAQSQGDWIVRAGAGWVNPTGDSNSLNFEGSRLDGYQIDVQDQLGFVINATYMATNNIGLEVLAAAPFKHDIEGDNVLGGLGELGSTRHLPPVLSVQYHFAPDANFRPYAGVGVNWTLFFDEKANDTLHQGIIGTSNALLGTDYTGGSTSLSIDDSFGLAFQIGADWQISDAFFLNFDLRWIDIEADAKLTTRTEDGQGFATTLTSRITHDIDPIVFSTTLGMRF
ncbi:OmpW/AlkL family protein [Wenzhouxiangella marina]|uniref:OmpW family protein n=1 Tax=Wenzhouxiangella marina TaxID=1579979 RepID=A0A0K0XVB3_9GAMM|nr:OmpW family outer membrane protein [Wenzhouxiangella marina]AKS41649.1 OmpW family protein [Wenzhouxiangella marina]MBB6086591.1 outer membrane protein [Wenzhouxiangella marina]